MDNQECKDVLPEQGGMPPKRSEVFIADVPEESIASASPTVPDEPEVQENARPFRVVYDYPYPEYAVAFPAVPDGILPYALGNALELLLDLRRRGNFAGCCQLQRKAVAFLTPFLRGAKGRAGVFRRLRTATRDSRAQLNQQSEQPFWKWVRSFFRFTLKECPINT